MTTKALVVLSGGQDSTTCLFWAKDNFDEVHAITFNYGQRHIIELESAKKVAEMAGVKSHEIVDVPNCLISTSPLTSDNPLEKYENAQQMDEVIGNRRELTFVPMRNALFLTIAANRAEALGIPNIVTGVCQMDNANYDDCREIFINATEDYINTALGHDHRGTQPIEIHTPLMHLTKAETVDLALNLEGCYEALAYSHTSYDGKYPPTDNNHANVLRADGFEQAGVPDPLVLRAWCENLMELPDTDNYEDVHVHEYLNRARLG
jgi:7-cyano-7-deazaguanine synthase